MRAQQMSALGSGLPEGFSFTVPGRLCPNNLVTRRYGNRSVKNARAVKDQARVRAIVREAAERAGWNRIENGSGYAVEVRILCWNQLGDIDGRQKVIMDAMGAIYKARQVIEPGIVYDDDSRVKRLIVEDDLDYNGPRYEVTITRMVAPQRPRKPRKMRFEDLGQEDWEALVTYKSVSLNPCPGSVKPILSDHVPAAWRKRAQKELQERAYV